MTLNSQWQVIKDEKGDDVYTWKDYEVKKVYERKAIAASYLNPKEPPTYASVGSWKATYSGKPMDTNPTFQTPVQVMGYCEQHDETLTR